MNIWAAIKTVSLVRDALELGRDVYEWFTEDDKPEPKPKRIRKKPDTTKLTQHHYNFICSARRQWEQYNKDNPKDRKSIQDLTDVINEKLGLNKSTRAYSRIWNGEIKPEDLPTGKPLEF